MSNGTALSTIIKQLTTILILLERPVVQQQLAALAFCVALAWCASKGFSYLEKRYVRRLLAAPSRWLPACRHLYFPILAIILTEGAEWFFIKQGWPYGLLNNLLLSFLIWTAYGVLVTILVVKFEEKVELYHKRILSPLFAWLVVMGSINNLFDVNSLAHIQLGTLFNTPIFLGGVITALILFYIFLVLTWVIQDFLVRVVMPHMNADAGVINSIVTVSRYLVITLGVFVAASSLGFDLSTLAFVGGGLTIAVGFGLQQIAANFISGILLLFEQALRPGDVIKINGELGTVQRLRIRSTLVRTLDNVELIIPNEKLLTSTVTSYTKSERLIRISLPVSVGYDSDPDEVHSILLQTTQEHKLIRSDPAPLVLFSGLGDSSLDFQLLVWIDEPSQMGQVRSDLYFLIFRAFTKHHIEIPYPQHDLNLRRGWEKLVVEIAENLARDRAKKLFGADHVNVQSHSGSPANAGNPTEPPLQFLSKDQ